MKKYLLFLLVFFAPLVSSYAVGTTYVSLTLTVGQSVEYYVHYGYWTYESDESINDNNVLIEKGQYSTYVKFTGLKRGTAIIRIYVGSSNYIIYTINVVDVVSITLPSTLSLALGDEYTFAPIIADAGATTTFSWQSTNPSVATIDSNGKLTTQGLGTTTIMCTASNGISGQCQVTVNPLIATNLQLDNSSVEMSIGETLQLNAQITPGNAQQRVIWSSSDKTIAKVINGVVYALDWGECLITATTVDGSNLSANCFVTILPQESNKCDVNGDGAVTAADVTEIYNYLLNN